MLDGPGCQVLAQMCFFVFTPALTFSKVAQAVSLASLTRLWPLLANMTASVLLGLASGALASRLLLPRTSPFSLLLLLSCSFGNVGNLPLGKWGGGAGGGMPPEAR